MTELTVVTQRASLADKIQFAKALAASNLLPRQYQGNPANLLFALEYAEALHVSPINAITSIHVIEGKPSASADLIAALVRRAGHKLRVTGDDRHAVAQIVRVDDPEFVFEVEWTLERARTAGLTGKGVWKQYPAAMLRSRAITEVARAAASDALFGIVYTPEELGAPTDDYDPPARPVRVVVPDDEAAVSTGWGERIGSDRPSVRPVDVTELPEMVGATDPARAPRPDRSAAPNTVADERPVAAGRPEATGTQNSAQNSPPQPVDETPATLPLDDPETPDDEPVDDAEPLITSKQRGVLMPALNALGARDHDVRVKWLSEVLERRVESTNDLTVTEASTAIDAALGELKDRERDARGGQR